MMATLAAWYSRRSVGTTGSDGLIATLFNVLLVGICVAVIWGLGRWVIGKLKLPEIAMTVWTGIFLFIGAVILINFLLSLAGHPIVAW